MDQHVSLNVINNIFRINPQLAKMSLLLRHSVFGILRTCISWHMIGRYLGIYKYYIEIAFVVMHISRTTWFVWRCYKHMGAHASAVHWHLWIIFMRKITDHMPIACSFTLCQFFFFISSNIFPFCLKHLLSTLMFTHIFSKEQQ